MRREKEGGTSRSLAVSHGAEKKQAGEPRRGIYHKTMTLAAVLVLLIFGLLGCKTAVEQGAAPSSPGPPTPAEVATDNRLTASSPAVPGDEAKPQTEAAKAKDAPISAGGGTKTILDRQTVNDGHTVTLWVTRDFGRQALLAIEAPLPAEKADALTLLKNHTEVETSYGGKFVNAVNGVRSEGRTGQQDWLFWINGTLSAVGAASCRLDPGDVVWWDFRHWSGSPAPAAVGAFPQPFMRHGCRILFAPARKAEAETLAENLRRHGVHHPTLEALSDDGITQRTKPTLVVGLWPELAACQPLAQLAARGPRSGAYGRIEDGTLICLDAEGREAARHGSGSGMVAALASGPGDTAAVWLCTGVDEEGLSRALGVFQGGTALQRCAGLAVTPQGPTRIPL